MGILGPEGYADRCRDVDGLLIRSDHGRSTAEAGSAGTVTSVGVFKNVIAGAFTRFVF